MMTVFSRVKWLAVPVLLFAADPAWPQAAPQRPPLPSAVEIDPDAAAQRGVIADQLRGKIPDIPGAWQAGLVTTSAGVTAGAFYDDNVFARTSMRLSDWAWILRPEFNVRMQGESYVAAAEVSLDHREYQRFDSETQTNGQAAMSITLRPREDAQIQARLKYARAHEERGSGEAVFNQFDRPTPFDQVDGALVFNHRFDGWWTSSGIARSYIHYEPASILGVEIAQDYRNGAVSVLTQRLGFVVAPKTSAFAEVSANQRNFGLTYFDSAGARVVGGLLFEPGPGSRVKGEVFAGAMTQDYNGETLQTITTWTYGLGLGYLLTERVVLSADGRREAKESLLNGGVSLIESTIGGRIDVRLFDGLTVGAGIAYAVQQFTGADRTDGSLTPLASIKHALNPNVTVGLDYRYLNYDSSGLGTPGYYRNVVLMTVTGRL